MLCEGGTHVSNGDVDVFSGVGSSRELMKGTRESPLGEWEKNGLRNPHSDGREGAKWSLREVPMGKSVHRGR